MLFRYFFLEFSSYSGFRTLRPRRREFFSIFGAILYIFLPRLARHPLVCGAFFFLNVLTLHLPCMPSNVVVLGGVLRSDGNFLTRSPSLTEFSYSQKQESFLKPLVDQYAKEGKDKKVVFEANFSKPNCKPKWFFRKDVSLSFLFIYLFLQL